MKKRSGAQRAMPVIPLTELQKMTTKRLLGRLARLRHCEDSLETSDMTAAETADCVGILFKSDARWHAAYTELKSVLAQREHLRRPAELPTRLVPNQGDAYTLKPSPRKRP